MNLNRPRTRIVRVCACVLTAGGVAVLLAGVSLVVSADGTLAPVLLLALLPVYAAVAFAGPGSHRRRHP